MTVYDLRMTNRSGEWQATESRAAMTRRVARLLSERGHLWLAEDEPPHSVKVRALGSVLVASLAFSHGSRAVVIKPMAPDASITGPGELHAVHERVRMQGEGLERSLPVFYGADPDRRWILMEYVPGATLLATLTGAMRSPDRGGAACTRLIAETARSLGALHRLGAADVGVTVAPRANRSYLADFEAAWTSPSVRRHLPPAFRDPGWLFDRLPASFFRRRDDRLLMCDVQPKNILVTGPGTPVFIDIDYGSGNPAIDLGQFLCGLDRLQFRHPFALPPALASAWKASFLDAYARQTDRESLGDIAFFYPYIMVISLQAHSARRFWFRPYLQRAYGRALQEFLANLRDIPVGWARHGSAALFVRGRGAGDADGPGQGPP
jgi:serine/threonine protein kinase